MKKIIATVLAMVMALALCSTAFAADPVYTKAYDNKGNNITNGATGYTVSTDTAQKPVGTSEVGKVKGFTVTYGTTQVKFVAGTAADYDLKLTADGRADLYLKNIPGNATTLEYRFKVTAFTAIGEKCEQLDVDATGTYYSHTDAAGETSYYEASETGINVLFNNELITVSAVNADLNAHDWKAASYNKDNTVATYKCADCGTVATVYKTADAAKAAGMAKWDASKMIGYNYTPAGTTATTTTTSSPKTFDAGIAMYVGMALTSVAGSAVVIGKKKEF